MLTATTVFNPAQGELAVSSDGSDAIVLATEQAVAGIEVTLNGNSIGILANQVQTLSVTGGPGANLIDISAITAAEFSLLSDVEISGGSGDDEIYGSEFDEQIFGEDGDDFIFGNGGADLLDGGAGDDQVESGDPVQVSLLQSGFNDASGVNSDGDPNSPYTIDGVLEGSGTGEPGWAGPWVRVTGAANLMLIQDEVVFEGDAAMSMSGGTAQAKRTWTDAQTGEFSVSQRARVSPGGNFITYLIDDNLTGTGQVGIQFRARAGGNFEVVDSGSVVRNTGISVPVDEWFEVQIEADAGAQTWTFSVNGVAFAQTIGFRGNPNDIDTVRYLNESLAPSYIDALTIDGPDVPVLVQGDTLLGNTGDDVLIGSEGDDTIDGGKGADTIDGNGGIDTIISDEEDMVTLFSLSSLFSAFSNSLFDDDESILI